MVNCPVCDNPRPAFKMGENMRELLWGGWTCPYCKSEMDRKGKLIKKNEKGLKKYEGRLYKEEYIKEKARLQAQKEHKKK